MSCRVHITAPSVVTDTLISCVPTKLEISRKTSTHFDIMPHTHSAHSRLYCATVAPANRLLIYTIFVVIVDPVSC